MCSFPICPLLSAWKQLAPGQLSVQSWLNGGHAVLLLCPCRRRRVRSPAADGRRGPCHGGGRAGSHLARSPAVAAAARLTALLAPAPQPSPAQPRPDACAECRNADSAEPVVNKLILDSLGLLTRAAWHLTTEHSRATLVDPALCCEICRLFRACCGCVVTNS